MYFVYLLRSIKYPNQTYVGYTENIGGRLEDHDDGKSFHTAKYAPWELIAYISFKDEKNAIAFEKYLKTGSGRSFAERRFFVEVKS